MMKTCTSMLYWQAYNTLMAGSNWLQPNCGRPTVKMASSEALVAKQLQRLCKQIHNLDL